MNYQIYSDAANVRINSLGAEICSITDKQGLEYIWQAHQQVWPRYAPVLFPIVGRLKNNRFAVRDKHYELNQHGFARDLAFDLIKQEGNLIGFELKAKTETKDRYPFDFVFRIFYRLHANRLSCSYQVMNPAQEPLLFSLGAHPGFNCPLLPDETFEDYYLEFETNELFYTELEGGLRTNIKHRLSLQNKKLYLTENLFNNDALVFENYQIDCIRLVSERSSHKITLECKDWPYFGIWTKKACRNFICLEPWYGVADHIGFNGVLSQKEGIIHLGAKKKFECSFSIVLD